MLPPRTISTVAAWLDPPSACGSLRECKPPLVRLATARAPSPAPQWALSRRGQNPESTKGALYSHALFAAGIQSLARENMALSAVSAVVSSSWLLRAAAFQKAPFKVAFAGSNPTCSQPVRSLLFNFRLCENCRHSNPRQREMMRDFHARVAKQIMNVALATPERWAHQVKKATEAGYLDPNITTTYEEMKKFVAEGNYTITVPNERHIQLEVGTFAASSYFSARLDTAQGTAQFAWLHYFRSPRSALRRSVPETSRRIQAEPNIPANLRRPTF